MISINPVTEVNIPDAAHSLATAFMNDPLQQYVFPDPEERRLKSPGHFEAVIRYGYLFGEVYTTPDLKGIAVWLTPGNTEVTPEKADKAGLGNLPDILVKKLRNDFSV